MLLCPEGAGAVCTYAHRFPTLVIQTQHRGHHVPAGAGLEGGGQFLRVADTASACPRPGAEASGKAGLGDKGLHLHPLARGQRGGSFPQVPYLFPLIYGKGEWTIFLGGVPLLRHKGLHLHIGGRHKSPGSFTQVDDFLPLVDVKRLGWLGHDLKRYQDAGGKVIVFV